MLVMLSEKCLEDNLRLRVPTSRDNIFVGGEGLCGVVAMERALRWLDENHWRFGLVLCAHTIFVLTVLLIALLRF